MQELEPAGAFAVSLPEHRTELGSSTTRHRCATTLAARVAGTYATMSWRDTLFVWSGDGRVAPGGELVWDGKWVGVEAAQAAAAAEPSASAFQESEMFFAVEGTRVLDSRGGGGGAALEGACGRACPQAWVNPPCTVHRRGSIHRALHTGCAGANHAHFDRHGCR